MSTISKAVKALGSSGICGTTPSRRAKSLLVMVIKRLPCRGGCPSHSMSVNIYLSLKSLRFLLSLSVSASATDSLILMSAGMLCIRY